MMTSGTQGADGAPCRDTATADVEASAAACKQQDENEEMEESGGMRCTARRVFVCAAVAIYVGLIVATIVLHVALDEGMKESEEVLVVLQCLYFVVFGVAAYFVAHYITVAVVWVVEYYALPWAWFYIWGMETYVKMMLLCCMLLVAFLLIVNLLVWGDEELLEQVYSTTVFRFLQDFLIVLLIITTANVAVDILAKYAARSIAQKQINSIQEALQQEYYLELLAKPPRQLLTLQLPVSDGRTEGCLRLRKARAGWRKQHGVDLDKFQVTKQYFDMFTSFSKLTEAEVEECARGYATQVYENLVREGGSDRVTVWSLHAYFRDRKARRQVMEWFDASQDGEISAQEVYHVVVNLHKQRKVVANTVVGIRSVTGSLQVGARFLVHFVLLFALYIPLLILVPFNIQLSIKDYLNCVFFLIAALGFMFQDTGRMVTSSLMWIFQAQPYDVGDCIRLSDDPAAPFYTVVRYNLFFTWLKLWNFDTVLVPNSRLLAGQIVNTTRSEPRLERWRFLVDSDAPTELASKLDAALKEALGDKVATIRAQWGPPSEVQPGLATLMVLFKHETNLYGHAVNAEWGAVRSKVAATVSAITAPWATRIDPGKVCAAVGCNQDGSVSGGKQLPPAYS